MNAPARAGSLDVANACARARSPAACRSTSSVSRSREPCSGGVTASRRCSSRAPCASTVSRIELLAAQELVVGVLQPALADPRARLHARVALESELRFRDLRDRAEQVRRERAARVFAQIALGHHDALERLRPLAHVVELRERDVGADGDVRVRPVRDAADHAFVDRPRADADRRADAGVQGREAMLARRERRDRHLTRRGLAARSSSRRRRSAWSTRARRRGAGERTPRTGAPTEPLPLRDGQRLAEVVGLLLHRLREHRRRDCTTAAFFVRTSERRSRSTMSPRGASIRSVRRPFRLAATRASIPVSTCSVPEPEEHDREQHERDHRRGRPPATPAAA